MRLFLIIVIPLIFCFIRFTVAIFVSGLICVIHLILFVAFLARCSIWFDYYLIRPLTVISFFSAAIEFGVTQNALVSLLKRDGMS